MSLADSLVQIPPRESSGSRSSNRFDFQKDWVLCRILELHLNNKDYLVVCDFHEDVIFLDGAFDPQSAAYYQIKTQTGQNWTIRRLLSRRQGTGDERLPSILGKLYLNFVRHPEYTGSLHFVSNSYYNFRLRRGRASRSLNTIECRQLSNPEIRQINTRLSDECGSECKLPVKPALFFEVTPLSVQDHSIHARGKVSEFLEAVCPGKRHASGPAYRTLFDEVRRKTNHEGQPANFEDLKTMKGIGRSDMEKLLSRMAVMIDFDALWSEASQRLLFEGMPAMSVRAIGAAWSAYEVDLMDFANDALQRLRSRVKTCALQILDENPEITLTQLATLVWESVRGEALGAYTSEYIKAMALMEAYVSQSF